MTPRSTRREGGVSERVSGSHHGNQLCSDEQVLGSLALNPGGPESSQRSVRSGARWDLKPDITAFSPSCHWASSSFARKRARLSPPAQHCTRKQVKRSRAEYIYTEEKASQVGGASALFSPSSPTVFPYSVTVKTALSSRKQ